MVAQHPSKGRHASGDDTYFNLNEAMHQVNYICKTLGKVDDNACDLLNKYYIEKCPGLVLGM